MSLTYTADGGGSVSSLAKQILAKYDAARKTPTRVIEYKPPVQPPNTYTTNVSTTAPYVPGISDNPAVKGTTAEVYTGATKTFTPSASEKYVGPLNRTQAPYVPGISDNPAIKGTTAEIYGQQNSDDTPNKTFFPNSSGNGFYGESSKNLGGSGGSGGSTFVPASTTPEILSDSGISIADLMSSGPQLERPTMRSGADMASHLGIVYDRALMENLMRDAVEKQYANLDSEYNRNQGLYYNNMNNLARSLSGAIRKGDMDAVRAGAAQGTNAATQLSALLGMSEQGSMGATELAALRGNLVNEREAALAKVAQDALKQYNDLGIQLGTLSNSELGHGAVMHSGDMASLWGAYTGLEGIKSNERINDAQLANNLATANINASAYRNSGGSNYTPSTPVNNEPSALEQQQEIYTRITMLREAQSAYKKSDPEYKEIEKQINELLGIVVPTKSTGGGSGVKYQPSSSGDGSYWGINGYDIQGSK